MRWAFWVVPIPAVTIFHIVAMCCLMLPMFAIVMIFKEDHPLWWVGMGAAFILCFPMGILEIFVGRMDSDAAMVLNTVFWVLCVSPLMSLAMIYHERVAKIIVSRFGRICLWVLILGMFAILGLAVGSFAPLTVLDSQTTYHNDLQDEEIIVTFCDMEVHREYGPAKEASERLRENWYRKFLIKTGYVGMVFGVLIGLLLFVPIRRHLCKQKFFTNLQSMVNKYTLKKETSA